FSNSLIFAGFPVSPVDPGKKLHACRNFVFLGLLHRFSNSYFPLVPPFISFLFRVPASMPPPLSFFILASRVLRVPASMPGPRTPSFTFLLPACAPGVFIPEPSRPCPFFKKITVFMFLNTKLTGFPVR
ncbi:hypothetical protein, partial [Paenibacillus dendritiformis]|uniref:hypothetical protein n=1 Tax=Paenibacillus dendritiformis TaxID=130049 RepID=UPI001C65C353